MFRRITQTILQVKREGSLRKCGTLCLFLSSLGQITMLKTRQKRSLKLLFREQSAGGIINVPWTGGEELYVVYPSPSVPRLIDCLQAHACSQSSQLLLLCCFVLFSSQSLLCFLRHDKTSWSSGFLIQPGKSIQDFNSLTYIFKKKLTRKAATPFICPVKWTNWAKDAACLHAR